MSTEQEMCDKLLRSSRSQVLELKSIYEGLVGTLSGTDKVNAQTILTCINTVLQTMPEYPNKAPWTNMVNKGDENASE